MNSVPGSSSPTHAIPWGISMETSLEVIFPKVFQAENFYELKLETYVILSYEKVANFFINNFIKNYILIII